MNKMSNEHLQEVLFFTRMIKQAMSEARRNGVSKFTTYESSVFGDNFTVTLFHHDGFRYCVDGASIAVSKVTRFIDCMRIGSSIQLS